ncbi:hypothetical protein NWP96_05375 [Mycoplasmopsis cynos]|nr:hypothetical protein [Mycoplasmopsis cynos]
MEFKISKLLVGSSAKIIFGSLKNICTMLKRCFLFDDKFAIFSKASSSTLKYFNKSKR